MPAGPDLNLLERVFTSSQVCQIARISPRQLQWWDERNVVPAEQSAHRRIYTARDVITILVIAELRRKGVSLQKIRSLLRALRRAIASQLRESLVSDSALYLLTDGAVVRLEARPAQIIDLLKQSRKPMFLVSVSDQVDRVARFRTTAEKARLRHSERQMALF